MQPPPVTWEVTGVSPATELDSNNDPIAGYRVNFTVSSGPSGSVFVRGTTFDAEVVRPLVADLASALHGVKSLKGAVGR